MNILIRFRKSIMFLLKVMMIAALASIFIGVWQSQYKLALFGGKGNYVVIFSYVLILFTFTVLYSGFKIGVLRLHEIIYSQSLSLLFANFVIYLELSLIARVMLNVIPILFCTIAQMLIIAACAYSANTVYFKLYRSKHILAIFDKNFGGYNVIKKMRAIKERYTIEKGVTTDCEINEIKMEIDKYEAVLICDFEKSLKNEILRYCYAKKKRIYLLPSTNDIIINNSYQSQIFDTPILICRNRGLSTEQRVLKRLMDIVISSVAIMFFSPFMIIISMAIKLYDRGPVLFKQNRITQDGKIFNVYKFRSMIVNADKDGAKKAIDNDDRITPVGKIIRPIRMDELPQLFNILFGTMSMVGPRPERTENVHEYTTSFPEFDLRHRVKAGLTGYAQIYGKYNTSPLDKLNMDLIYIETYSLLRDFKLLVMTIKILFVKESTAGFSEESNALSKKTSKHEKNQ